MFLSILLAAAFAQSPVSAARTEDQRLESAVLEIIRRHPEVVFDAVMSHQQERARKERLVLWKAAAKVPISLDLTLAPKLGPANAELTLVEVGSFRCAACVAVQSAVLNVLEKHEGRIQLVFLHAPPADDHLAREAARAAWAAQQQGKFFEYKSRLLQFGGQFSSDDLTRIASSLKLDLARFESDRQGDLSERHIAADIERVRKAHLAGTPSFVLNGVPVSGAIMADDFDQLIGIVTATAKEGRE